MARFAVAVWSKFSAPTRPGSHCLFVVLPWMAPMIAGALGVVEVPVVVGWGRTGARMNGSVAVAVILVVATVLGARHAFEWVPDRVLAARVAVVLEGVAVEEEASAASVRAAGWELVARAVGRRRGWRL